MQKVQVDCFVDLSTNSQFRSKQGYIYFGHFPLLQGGGGNVFKIEKRMNFRGGIFWAGQNIYPWVQTSKQKESRVPKGKSWNARGAPYSLLSSNVFLELICEEYGTHCWVQSRQTMKSIEVAQPHWLHVIILIIPIQINSIIKYIWLLPNTVKKISFINNKCSSQ